MRLAIMQPYLFPYIGYFQLIAAADKFVVYDDVSFIKQGWINRNQILVNGKSFLFTVPLSNQSSFQLIKDTEINTAAYERWLIKFLKTLTEAYRKAVNFERIFPVVKSVFEEPVKSIADLCKRSLEAVCLYLEIKTAFVWSSTVYENAHLKSQNRVIDICKREKAEYYLNASGGAELYDKKEFVQNNIELNFIKPTCINYQQLNDNFVPWLSIIDVLMFNSKDEVHRMLFEFEVF